MQYAATLSAVLFSGILLIPAGAKGQSHSSAPSSTAPAWVREVTSLYQVRDIGAGKDGEVYVVSGLMLARYDKDGMQRWVREGALKERRVGAYELYDAHELYAVAVGNDRIYTSEGSPLAIDSQQLTAAGIGIGVYTPGGDSIRTILLGDRHYRDASDWRSNILGLGLDDAGNIYAAGIYDETLFLGPDTLVAFSTDHLDDVFLVSYTSEGALRWSQRVGGPDFDTIMPDCRDYLERGVFTIDGHGNTYLSGCFGEGAVFGEGQPGEVTLADEVRALASYDTEGNLQWVGHATGVGNQIITTIDINPAGDLYVAGQYDENVQLGYETLGSGMRGGFLAKYDTATITSSETTPELPSTATLTSNYPNPFTDATTIEYALPASGPVHLSVYDMLGREVAILVDGVQHAGKHASLFDGMSLPSGTYLYRLEAAGQVRSGLMTLMK